MCRLGVGEVDVGDWSLEFDAGGMAGPGDAVEPPCGVPNPRMWTENLRQRRVSIATYYVDTSNTDALPAERSRFFGKAATVVHKGSGLYVSVSTRGPTKVCDFLKAVRTLEVFSPES